MTLLEAAKKGAEWMRWWISQGGCDCETGHSCGLDERRKELEEIEQTIKAEEGEILPPLGDRVCSLCGKKSYGVMKPVYKKTHDGLLCHKCDRA